MIKDILAFIGGFSILATLARWEVEYLAWSHRRRAIKRLAANELTRDREGMER